MKTEWTGRMQSAKCLLGLSNAVVSDCVVISSITTCPSYMDVVTIKTHPGMVVTRVCRERHMALLRAIEP